MNENAADFDTAMEAYYDERDDEAVAIMEKCAREENVKACVWLYNWYREKEAGNVQYQVKAEFWFSELLKLAAKENSRAQCSLNWILRFTGENHISEANSWLEKAAENGDGDAQFHLAWYIESGIYGYKVDTLKSNWWHEKAFQSGYPEAVYREARKRLAINSSDVDALMLMKSIAEAGFRPAMDLLGKMQ